MPSEDAQEIADILDAVAGRVPNLLRSVLDELYSPKAGKQMGSAIGAFYEELTRAGLPPDRALQLAEDYASPFGIIRSVLGDAGGGAAQEPFHFSWSRGKSRRSGGRREQRSVPSVPAPLELLFNNAGTSDDDAKDQADLDGVGWSLSAQALAEAGVTPGSTMALDQLTYRWPDVAPGRPNNVEAHGQPVQLPSCPGAKRLGVLGLATHGPSAGIATLHFADGRTQPVALCFPDSTLGDGDAPIPPATRIAVRLPRRNHHDESDEAQETFVFASTVAFSGESPVRSLTLPTSTDQGALHVFAVALGD